MQKDTSNQHVWWAARLFTLIFVPAIGAYTLLEPFGRDQGIHATIAYALDNGLVTYRDVYNMKPPLTTAMHWLSQALFGHSMISIRVLDLIVATLTALGLVEIGRLLGRKPVFGFAVSLGFSVLYYSFGFWEHSQTDGWAGFLVVPALLLMLIGWARPRGKARLLAMLAAGAVLGVAFGFKYTIGGAGILIFTPLLTNLLRQNRPVFLLSDFLACVAGGVAVLTIIVATLALYGAWSDFLEIQSFIMGYVAHTPADPPRFLHGFQLPGMYSPYMLGVVAVGLLFAINEWMKTKQSTLLVIVVLWVLAGWVSGYVQGKGFGYHFLPIVPAYAVLIGVAVEYISKQFADRAHSNAITIVLLLGLYVPSMAATLDRLAIMAASKLDLSSVLIAPPDATPDFDIAGTLKFADVLKEHREPDDSLFVWGYSTMLYFLVETPPRYRFPYSWPLMVDFYDGRYNRDLLDRLKAAPPDQFVVQSQDATPWATGNEKSSDEMLTEFPELEQFLALNYQIVEVHPRFSLYERRGP